MTVLFKPILALHIIHFSSCGNYWGGGGGGQNDMFAPPPIISLGGRLLPPPPPRIDASDCDCRISSSPNCIAYLICIKSNMLNMLRLHYDL